MSTAKGKRGVLEEHVERYFVDRVEACGGMAEKFTSPGRRGVPDRIVTWAAHGFARIHFVELKTIGGALDPAQKRDHARRKNLNCHVFVIWSRKQVDDYITRFAEPPF